MNVQNTMNIKDYKGAENSSYNAEGIHRGEKFCNEVWLMYGQS
jgi:hypothetical protein